MKTGILTGRAVVANSEGQGFGGIDVTQAVAGDGSATNVSSGGPDNLGEVTPVVEVGHVGVGLAVQVGVVAHLVVVHEVGDHNANFGRLNTISNVLTVATAVNGTADLR